ncbi:Tyrosine-protein kinase [Caenorhabditis elegans]|uniref:Tyrosine-protein kinase n=1 Tax=Caenorhabditis elegans TaxID=6239 RepID=Q22243_CAEEL|nr:Tyrosine-protein kinase [Caenorhabditis elegans]CCD63310.1 Tyrosine-protein kinase [Caenorhabditis elegans]|eukprot:NP_501307.1 Tyrosine-protein kinase [Caenorhabditis elegans]
MGSNELFTRSVYMQSSVYSNNSKSSTSSSSSNSIPTQSAPAMNAASSPSKEPAKQEKEDDKKEVEEKKEIEKSVEAKVEGKVKAKVESTQNTDNSQELKAPEEKPKKKKKKKSNLIVSASVEKLSIVPEKEDFSILEKKLREFNFYHGFLPREDLHTTLHNPGDFLLRVSEVVEGEHKVNREVILSLIPVSTVSKDEEDRKKVRNVVIKRVTNLFFCEITRTFESISDLVTYYTKNPGGCASGTFQLKHPILQQSWEFMHSDVTVGKVLGEGAFGKVCSGTLKLKDGTNVDVAIKMTKVSAFLSKMKIKEMMNEARFIRNFNHKNVVRLYGVAHHEQPLYILLELVKGGSLQDHMKKEKGAVSIVEKIKFCSGAGRGIEYLHQNNCIHRDIAARNCLLHEKEVKITDFGLSRTGPVYKMKTACKLPVKWLAPETLSTLSFSFATDTYSWGVTCYEVFADGVEPFFGIQNSVVKTDILANKFLQMPPTTPESIKKYMEASIFVEGSRRATMTSAIAEFEKIKSALERPPSDMLSVGAGAKKVMKLLKRNKQEKYSKGD